MQIYFVILLMGIVFLLYAVIGFMLYKRSKERNIKSRSPVLLHITHWANYLEISLAIINIFPQYGIDLWNFQELSLFQSLGLIAHYLVFFPYILRCYRLYFVFHLDKDWAIQNNSFKRHINRTKQR